MTVFLGHICGKSSGRFQETNILFLNRYPVIPNEEKKNRRKFRSIFLISWEIFTCQSHICVTIFHEVWQQNMTRFHSIAQKMAWKLPHIYFIFYYLPKNLNLLSDSTFLHDTSTECITIVNCPLHFKFPLFFSVSDFTHSLAKLQEQYADDLHHLVDEFRHKNNELRAER